MSEPRQRQRAVAAASPPAPRRLLWLPSARSVVAGLVVAAVAALTYVVARESSLFAVRTISIAGAPPAVEAKLRDALAPIAGHSLVSLRPDEVDRLATSVPEVESVSYDRAFPHTLRIMVRLERPLAVVRQGPRSWLVARSGRVVRLLPRGALPALPRIWEPPETSIIVGAPLPDVAVAALQPVGEAGLLGRVASVRSMGGELTYVLRGGIELRVGGSDELLLKLAVARQILAEAPPLASLDVSVPERPVATPKPQVSS